MYTFSDLHGNYNLWKQIEQFLINNEAYAICLGDVVDRGPDGWEIFKEVIDSPYVITFLLGNHELMMYEALAKDNKLDLNLWFYNGGEPTYKAAINDPLKDKYLKKFAKTFKYYVIYENWFVSHAGITIPKDKKLSFNSEMKDCLIWDRNHIYNSSTKEGMNILHGHTPVQYLGNRFDRLSIPYSFDSEQGILTYCNGQKYCIDLCTIETQATTLFDLNTKKGMVFTDESAETI